MTQDKCSSKNAKEVLTDYLDDLLGTSTGRSLPEKNARPETASDAVSHHSPEPPVEAADPVVKQSPDKVKEEKRSSTYATPRSGASSTFDAAGHPSGSNNRPAPRADSRAIQTGRDAVFAEPEAIKPLPKLAPPVIKTASLAEAKSTTEPVAELRQDVEPSASEAPAADPVELQTETKDVGLNDVSGQGTGRIQKPAEWPANGRPEWAQNRFECLLFSVAGLKLAVPLVSLGSIHRIESDFTPLVGRADWFLGLYRTGDRNIQVVDTAKWVMPRQYHDKVVEGYQFLIRLGDSNWGMACDAVAEAIQLDPDQVKWRTERSKRAWLSGTVIDHMCALLDAEMLSFLLQEDAMLRR